MKKIKPNYTLREALVKTLGEDDIHLIDIQAIDEHLTTIELIPSIISITNRDEVYDALYKGEDVYILLEDDIGTTLEQFDEMIASGDIVIYTDDPSSLEIEGRKIKSLRTAKSVKIIVYWISQVLKNTLQVIAGPIPTALHFQDESKWWRYLSSYEKDFFSTKLIGGKSSSYEGFYANTVGSPFGFELEDDIGTTLEDFYNLIASGDIVIEMDTDYDAYELKDHYIYQTKVTPDPNESNYDGWSTYIHVKATWTTFNLVAEHTYKVPPYRCINGLMGWGFTSYQTLTLNEPSEITTGVYDYLDPTNEILSIEELYELISEGILIAWTPGAINGYLGSLYEDDGKYYLEAYVGLDTTENDSSEHYFLSYLTADGYLDYDTTIESKIRTPAKSRDYSGVNDTAVIGDQISVLTAYVNYFVQSPYYNINFIGNDDSLPEFKLKLLCPGATATTDEKYQQMGRGIVNVVVNDENWKKHKDGTELLYTPRMYSNSSSSSVGRNFEFCPIYAATYIAQGYFAKLVYEAFKKQGIEIDKNAITFTIPYVYGETKVNEDSGHDAVSSNGVFNPYLSTAMLFIDICHKDEEGNFISARILCTGNTPDGEQTNSTFTIYNAYTCSYMVNFKQMKNDNGFYLKQFYPISDLGADPDMGTPTEDQIPDQEKAMESGYIVVEPYLVGETEIEKIFGDNPNGYDVFSGFEIHDESYTSTYIEYIIECYNSYYYSGIWYVDHFTLLGTNTLLSEKPKNIRGPEDIKHMEAVYEKDND